MKKYFYGAAAFLFLLLGYLVVRGNVGTLLVMGGVLALVYASIKRSSTSGSRRYDDYDDGDDYNQGGDDTGVIHGGGNTDRFGNTR